MPTYHDASSLGTPSTTRSPPTFTTAPVAPASMQLLGDDVGREALADATQIDGGLDGDGERGRVVVDARRRR